MAMRGQGSRARISRPVLSRGERHGVQSRRSKLFKSPEGREMVQCTWLDKKPREHRAAFVMDSLEVAEATTLRLRQGERA
jgi:hypothetical protein